MQQKWHFKKQKDKKKRSEYILYPANLNPDVSIFYEKKFLLFKLDLYFSHGD